MRIETVTREEKMLDAIAKGTPANITPITRKEMFLAKAGGQDVKTPEPITREEMFLSQITSGGGGSVNPTAPPSDVNFIDYDGTILHSYTVAEAQALTEMPPLPSHDGLICQGWNFDLETIKEYNRALTIGAMFITDDGKTRLHFRFWNLPKSDVTLIFSQSVSRGVTIDWGDGSATETVSGKGAVSAMHKYRTIGDYTVSLAVAEGCRITLGGGYNKPLTGSNGLQSVNIGARVGFHQSAFTWLPLANITIPNYLTSLGSFTFSGCSKLTSITIPSSVTKIDDLLLNACSSLVSIAIPASVTSLGSSNGTAFQGCNRLMRITIPDSVGTIPTCSFAKCSSLRSLTIPSGVKEIRTLAFSGCEALEYHIKPTNPPWLENTNAFQGIHADCIMYVPAASLEAYKTATNWSTYADRMRGE